ncbi:MAG: hypothetical protein G01um101419_677 [Parcubacteria group bacterium Gr01-1014_19]|nr:MAG: hypothetical protein G01um101419_677 [Parcubacteria group bacterium Gr01-1014_19]
MTFEVWLAILLIASLLFALVAGKILKKNRELLEEEAIDRCREAITRFLNREEDNGVMIYRDRQSGQIKSEEALDRPDPCVICLEYGSGDDEDLRPKLVSIRDCYIPLCTQHKRFITQCLEEKISLDDGPDPLSD